MKVLITGTRGQLGKSLIELKPMGINIIPTTREDFNLENLEQCKKFLISNRPDWVINAGAYTAVDNAEIDKDKVMLINAEAPRVIAETLNNIGGNLLQISTDFVFDGNQSTPYCPEDKTNPLNLYGKSKLLSENLIKESFQQNNQYIILRTSWVIGPIGKNFLTTMLKLHNSKENISVVCDQIGCFTSTETLANICWLIVQRNLVDNYKNQKILHWTQAGVSSWFDIAYEIGKIAEKLKVIKKAAKVLPISSDQFITKAKRPNFSLLNCEVTEELLYVKKIYWRDSLYKILQEVKDKNLFNVS